MRRYFYEFSILALLAGNALAASKPHVITFGKWTTVQWYAGAQETSPVNLKVRGLYVDSRLREFTLGLPHEVTERLFVVRRAFQINDALPEESNAPAHWRWQRGGWLLVDRITGHISSLNLPDFDPYYSSASWYRDYVAYCGVSDDGKKVHAIVAQLGRRKPVLKQQVSNAAMSQDPDSACPPPGWQRQPARVTFDIGETQKVTFSVRGHAADVATDEADEEDASAK